MDPVKFPEANCTFVAQGCGDLPALRAVFPCGTHAIISCWRLTWRERLQLLWRGRLRLYIYGTAQPPVAIEVDRPFAPDLQADADGN